MKKRYIITVITSILMVVLIAGIQKIILEKKDLNELKYHSNEIENE